MYKKTGKHHRSSSIGCYRFYEDKLKLLVYFFGCILFVYIGFMLRQDEDISLSYIYLGILFFGYGAIYILLKLYSNTPFMEITPSYIKMDNFDKLFWSDIYELAFFQSVYYGIKVKFWYFKVDISKYKLTLKQKLNLKCGFPPFYIYTKTLNEKDRETLKNILNKKFPLCDLEDF